MKKYFCFICFVFAVYFVQGKISLSSPNGQVSITFYYDKDSLYYKVNNSGYEIVSHSKIDWTFSNTKVLKVIENYMIDTSYCVRGGHSLAIDYCQGMIIDVGGYKIEARAYNDGVTWRYLGFSNKKIKIDDRTEFHIPKNTILWSQPNVKHYEGTYSEKKIENFSVGERLGSVVTIRYPFGLYAATTESGGSNFAGMSFTVSSPHIFQTTLAGTCYLEGDIVTPWRIVMTGDLNTLVNSDIVSNVSAPAKFSQNLSWIKPGRSVWSWLAWNSEVSFQNMKLFSLQASQLGFEYNLVDEGWSYWKDGEKDCWDLVKELVTYSDSLGVKIWLWKAYPDRRNVEGINTRIKRRNFFRKCKETGIVGIKIDFFDSEEQEVMRFYEEALSDAAEYELMLSFHGANKPMGQSRTYPNEMTREAIRGMENRPPWAIHNTILPFTRLLVGHADFTPVILPPTIKPNNINNRQESRVGEVTTTHQFATAVIYTSPLLCYAVNPYDLLNHPFRDMLTSVPTTWDETIVLPGSEIGKRALFARRNGDRWFIVGVTVDKSDLVIPLVFLDDKKYYSTEMCDVPNSQFESERKCQNVIKKDSLNIRMNKAGGYFAILQPLDKD